MTGLYSHWHVVPGGEIRYIRKASPKDHFRIVHVDDHHLIRQGLIDLYIRPHFPHAEVVDFDNGDDAFAYISRCIIEDDLPDLIITDVTHPGMRGDALVNSIRQAEISQGSLRPLPIIVLTLCDPICVPLLKPGKTVDAYFCKSVSVEDFTAAIGRVLGCS